MLPFDLVRTEADLLWRAAVLGFDSSAADVVDDGADAGEFAAGHAGLLDQQRLRALDDIVGAR